MKQEECSMLSEEEKAKIRMEEIFRGEVRQEITRSIKWYEKLWIAAKHPLVLYFFSAVLVAGVIDLFEKREDTKRQLRANKELRAESLKSFSQTLFNYSEALEVVYTEVLRNTVSNDSSIIVELSSDLDGESLLELYMKNNSSLIEIAMNYQKSVSIGVTLSNYLLYLSKISRITDSTLIKSDSVSIPPLSDIPNDYYPDTANYTTMSRLVLSNDRIPALLAEELHNSASRFLMQMDLQIYRLELSKDNHQINKYDLSNILIVEAHNKLLDGKIPEKFSELRIQAITDAIEISNLDTLINLSRQIKESFIRFMAGESHDPSLIVISERLKRLLSEYES